MVSLVLCRACQYLYLRDRVGDDFTGRPPPSTPSGGGVSGDNTKNTSGSGLSKTAQKILNSQKQPPAPTLFLGNLGFETTDDSIRELFESHRHPEPRELPKDGKKEAPWIRKIRMGTFEDSGLC